jgi:hypothetical protein
LPGWNDSDQADRPFKATPLEIRTAIDGALAACLTNVDESSLGAVARAAAAYLRHEFPARARDARAEGAAWQSVPDVDQEGREIQARVPAELRNRFMRDLMLARGEIEASAQEAREAADADAAREAEAARSTGWRRKLRRLVN